MQSCIVSNGKLAHSYVSWWIRKSSAVVPSFFVQNLVDLPGLEPGRMDVKPILSTILQAHVYSAYLLYQPNIKFS